MGSFAVDAWSARMGRRRGKNRVGMGDALFDITTADFPADLTAVKDVAVCADCGIVPVADSSVPPGCGQWRPARRGQ